MIHTQAQQTRVRKIAALYVAIHEALLEAKQIPEGHIYAHLMGQCTLEEFNIAIGLLIKTGKVTSKNHLLTLNLSTPSTPSTPA